MDNKDQPVTSRRQVVGGTYNKSLSRKKKPRRERVTKKETRKIYGPRGERPVDVNPGDTIVTTTDMDGNTVQYVLPGNHTTSNSSTSNKRSKSSTSKTQKLQKRTVPVNKNSTPNRSAQNQNLTSNVSLHNRTLDLDLLRKSWDDFNVDNFNYKKTPYSHWYNQYKSSLPGNELGFSNEDLVFLNDYINNEKSVNPYLDANGYWIADSNDVEANKKHAEYIAKRNALNIALSKKPNQNDLYKVIWPNLSPYHTPERSAEDHKYISTIYPGTPKEMGSMNWEAATGTTGPNFSIEDFTPEYNHWTAGFDNVELRTPMTQSTSRKTSTSKQTSIEDMIKQNPGMFRAQYDYAQQYNGAFDYAPSSFDSQKLNSIYKYGGIGDFMDTYGLSPQELYSILEQYFSNK